MNLTVDYDTAKELRDAGFPQYIPASGAFYGSNNDQVASPNALEILEQMPPMTSISKNYFGVWECSFAIGPYQTDYRADPCPHKAAAYAYIAWKKGRE